MEHRIRTVWTRGEVSLLRDLASSGSGAREIAERMGHEEARVRAKANRIGLLIPHVHQCTVRCIRLGRARS